MFADERTEMQARYEYVSTGAETARLLSRWLAGRIHTCQTAFTRAVVDARRRLYVWRSELERLGWVGAENADLGR